MRGSSGLKGLRGAGQKEALLVVSFLFVKEISKHRSTAEEAAHAPLKRLRIGQPCLLESSG